MQNKANAWASPTKNPVRTMAIRLRTSFKRTIANIAPIKNNIPREKSPPPIAEIVTEAATVIKKAIDPLNSITANIESAETGMQYLEICSLKIK